MELKKGDIVESLVPGRFKYGIVTKLESNPYFVAIWYNTLEDLKVGLIEKDHGIGKVGLIAALERSDKVKKIKYLESPLYKTLTKDVK